MPPPRTKHGPPSARTAARVRALMDDQGVTVAELAGRCDLTRAAVYNFLGGSGDVMTETMRRMLAALGASWSDLDSD